MDFQKYSSLENSYRERFVNQCRDLGVSEWVATEKVHGANFSFIVYFDYVNDDWVIQPAKRSGVIGKSPEGVYDFYGCTEVVEKYSSNLMNLFELIGEPFQIYGELYGQSIQKKVDYGPKNFVAFDIKILRDNEFLSWPEVKASCKVALIPVVPEVGRGSLEEMLALSPEFMSQVSPRNDQLAEGFVIKPLDGDYYLKSGSRAILKQKSSKFSEKNQKKTVKKPQTVPDELSGLYQGVCQYLNDNRLRSVLSKFGDVSQKDFGKIQGLLTQDAKEDYEKDNGEIEGDDWKKVSKFIAKESANVVRKDWLNILDGNF